MASDGTDGKQRLCGLPVQNQRDSEEIVRYCQKATDYMSLRPWGSGYGQKEQKEPKLQTNTQTASDYAPGQQQEQRLNREGCLRNQIGSKWRRDQAQTWTVPDETAVRAEAVQKPEKDPRPGHQAAVATHGYFLPKEQHDHD